MASFRKHENGTWEYRVRYKDPITQKHKEKSKRGFKTKKEAQLAAAKLEEDIDSRTLPFKDVTFQQVFDEWWDTHSRTIKQSSRYTTSFKFKKHILPAFGKMKLKDITPAYCQKVINKIAEEIESANDYKIQANQVFKYAVRMNYIVKNPIEHAIVPKKENDFLAEKEPKRNFWTKDEVKKFIELAKLDMEQQDYIMFYLLIYTGMRKGELLSLEWKDVSFDNKSIFVRQTLFFKNKKEILQKVKTYESRTIHIDQKTIRLIQKWKVRQRELLLAQGVRKEPKFVLTRCDLRPLRLGYPNDKLKSFVKIHGLHNVTVHGLRHTHASLLFEAGASIKEVQARLGHRDINTTMNIYTHVTETTMEKTADTFSNYMER